MNELFNRFKKWNNSEEELPLSKRLPLNFCFYTLNYVIYYFIKSSDFKNIFELWLGWIIIGIGYTLISRLYIIARYGIKEFKLLNGISLMFLYFGTLGVIINLFSIIMLLFVG